MRARVALASLLALACATAQPLLAEAPLPAPNIAGSIAAAQAAAAADDCAAVLAALDPLAGGAVAGDDRVMIQRLRLICLGREGRYAELAAVQRELAVAMPRDGVVRAFGVIVALGEERFSDAAEQLTTLAATSPGSLDILTGAAVRQISANLGAPGSRQARGQMLIALARADWQPSDNPEMRIGFAEGAIVALLDQGEPDEAEGLLERIDQPELLSSMLVDRHYAPIWPALEARLGPAGGTSVDHFALDRLADYTDMPGSEPALRDAANAMLLLGHHDDVLRMTKTAAVTSGMSRDAVQTILLRARALAVLGRDEEAASLLAQFMAVDPARTPDAATALITYAEFLDETGQSERGLEAARAIRIKATGVLNDFGQRWLDRTEICTLSALGRTDEANGAMDRLKARASDNRAAVIEALLCAKRPVEASAVALQAFGDEETASALLYQFQPGASLWAPSPSRLRALWIAFLARPEIKAAFDRHGRILPKAFWPDKAPRAIPRRPSNGLPLA